nr:PAS domain S-box protein [Ignavibacteria bacterium]
MQKNDMKTILLVEDEAIISLSTSKILQKNGFNVITVHKGEKAVDAVRDFTTIDIVLMDINLGKGMDGAEAAEQILRIRALPVVFLTSHSEQAVVDRIKSITRYGYVIKNSGEFVLLESINMALELFDANRNLLNDIKKREQAEAELKSSEVKFSTVFHASPAGICINDAEDGRFIDVNKAFERITGLNRLELLGKDPLGLGLWSYEYAEEISAELQSSGKLFNREILYTSKITGNRNVVISCEFISLNGRNCVLTIVNDVTDQKLNLEALAESRKILNSTHRTAMLESWIYDYNTKQLHLGNRGNLSGFEEKQISGFDFFIQKTHPEDLEFHRKEIQKLLDGKPVLFKVRVILDEMTRWFLVQADIELDSSEKPVKAFGVTIDITGSKAVEEENLKHISLLKATLESTADGILVVDLKRKISSYNKRFTEMWGINEELMFTGNDNTVIRFVLGQLEAADEFIERVEWLYHHPAEESFDTIRFKDGRLFERYSIPQIIDDEIAGRVWNFRDVTEKNNFEKALKRSEERTKAIINSVPDLLFVLDNKGVFIDYFSRSDEHLYVPVNRFMGKHLYDIFDKELADEAIRKIESAIENRVIEKLEYSLNMNGDVKYFEDRIAPISDNEVLTIIRDITDEKKKEEALLVRENVLAKITDFAGLIFNSGVNDESINHFLAELGKAFSVSRAYIFRKIFETDEMISFRQINEWCDEGVISSSEVLDVENFVVDKSSPYMIKVSSLIKEGFLPGNMNEMDNEYEKYLMEVQNLKSYLFISIYIKNTFWGMIGFDECKRLRKWEDFEIQVLKTAAYIIGGALQKDKMERELADNKQLYFTLVNSSPDSVSVTDLNGNLIFSSKHAMELFGYEPDENTDGLSVFSWVSPQFQELAYTKFSEIIKTGKTESASFILNRKDGSEFYAEITASRFDDGDGNPRGLIIVTRDITEVLKTRLALEEEAISRRILIEGSSDGIVVVDDSGKAIEVNRKFCEMLGYTHAELKNMHVCQWDDKFNRSDLEKMIESVDEKGDFFETVHKRKDGSVYDVEVSSNAAIV